MRPDRQAHSAHDERSELPPIVHGMSSPADSQALRQLLDRFVAAHVIDTDGVLSARVLSDRNGNYLAVAVRSEHAAQLPEHFEGVRVLVNEQQPGRVAAGPLR
jgi:hypothetical protein